MSRRTGNNYSGPRWVFSPIDRSLRPASEPGESLTLSGSSRNRPGKSSAPFTQAELDAAVEPHVDNEGYGVT